MASSHICIKEVFNIEVIKLTIDNTTIEEYEKVYFAKHPKAKKSPIAHPYHESINQWMIMKRPQMNALKQRWKEFIKWVVVSSNYKDTHVEQCEIKFITYYRSTHRHDIDNSCPKFIIDGLCESGLILDDDSKHITSLTMQCFVDVDNPRTEIEIYVSKLLTDYKQPELKEEIKMATKKSKMSRISVNAFEKVMKEVYTPTESFDWHGIDVVVKKTLSLKEMLEFVDSVVKSCFTKDTNAYMPEIKDFVTRVCILEKYANFTMPSNVESKYVLVYQTDVVDRVLQIVNQAQFNEIRAAIGKKVENIAQANIEAVDRQMNELYNAFSNLQDRLSNLFDGVNGEDIRAVASALANGTLDEEKIVKAYMGQTAEAAGQA